MKNDRIAHKYYLATYDIEYKHISHIYIIMYKYYHNKFFFPFKAKKN